MSALFYRDGRAFTGRPLLSEKSGAPYTFVKQKCSRCGGAGGADKWAHTGWTCFDCSGSGAGPDRVEKLYSAEKLAKLNAAKAKADARKAAERAARAEQREIEAAKRRAAFCADMEPLFMLANLVLAKDAEFARTMIAQCVDRADISERQIEVIENAYVRRCLEDERLARCAVRQHVGEVGERIRVVGTVRKVYTMSVQSFRGYGTDTLYIVTIDGDDGATYVYKGNKGYHFGAEKERVALMATIKEHSEYRDEKQTLIARPKFEEEMANG